MSHDEHAPRSTSTDTGPAKSGHTAAADATVAAGDDAPRAECVLCREPTEYPESHRGITLCPACEWREAERTACSG